jgi:hypothetical protein
MGDNQAQEDLKELWAHANKNQKTELLKAHGVNTSFAATKSIGEMVDRGGGLGATALLRTCRTWREKNPGKKIHF